jgi:hypothetical protein
MPICYECLNWNHVDCVIRKPRSKKKCSCWCTKKGKYLKPKIKKKRKEYNLKKLITEYSKNESDQFKLLSSRLLLGEKKK